MKLLWGLVLVVALAACSQPQQKTDKPAFRALGQSVPVEEARSDEAIGYDVRHQIDLAGPNDLTGVIVVVDGGTVTLRGSVTTPTAALRAEAAAKAVKGVKLVINQIQSTQAGPYQAGPFH